MNNKKKSAIYGVALGFLAIKLLAWVVSPLTGLLFPKIEDVFAENKISTDVLKDLGASNKNIRVRTLNNWGYAHIALTNPYKAYKLYKRVEHKGLLGFAQNKDKNTGNLHYEIIIGTRINIIPNSKNSSDIFYSKEQMGLHTLMHEIRHISKINNAAGVFMDEVDAEYKASVAVAKVTNDPYYIKDYMNYRTLYSWDKAKGYNYGLYADAKLKGEDTPSKKEMKTAINGFITMMFNKCVVMGEEVPKYTRRKAQLYLEANKAYKKLGGTRQTYAETNNVQFVNSYKECKTRKTIL